MVRTSVGAFVEHDRDRLDGLARRDGRERLGHARGAETHPLPAGIAGGSPGTRGAANEMCHLIGGHYIEARRARTTVATHPQVVAELRQVDALHAMEDDAGRGIGW